MKTLMREPCPKCSEYKLHRVSKDEAYCVACWSTTFIGTVPELTQPGQGSKGQPGRIASGGVKLK